MDKRYQIFISSTYRDLGPERSAIYNSILSLNNIPAGMELFPSSTDTPWELITGIIDQSDYFVLVIAGLYGSTTREGISYTEKEYDYALAAGKPILAFLHEDPEQLPAKVTEKKEDAREKLDAFRKKVSDAHTRTTWTDAPDLKSKVMASLVSEFWRRPAVGWVRADNAETVQKYAAALERTKELEKEIAQLRQIAVASPVARGGGSMGAEIVDSLSLDAIDWFLDFSHRTAGGQLKSFDDLAALSPTPSGVPPKSWAENLKRRDILNWDRNAEAIRVTNLGWEVREELNRRKLMAALHKKPDGVFSPAALCESCDGNELRLLLQGLEASGLISWTFAPPGSFNIAVTLKGKTWAGRHAAVFRR